MAMRTVLKIEAPNDTNGNPRRGWIVSSIDEDLCKTRGGVGRHESTTEAFVDEGYEGTAALDKYLLLTEECYTDLGSIPVAASFYRAMRKEYGT